MIEKEFNKEFKARVKELKDICVEHDLNGDSCSKCKYGEKERTAFGTIWTCAIFNAMRRMVQSGYPYKWDKKDINKLIK